MVIDHNNLIEVVPESWAKAHPTEQFPQVLVAYPKKSKLVTQKCQRLDPPDPTWNWYPVTVMKRGILSK